VRVDVLSRHRPVELELGGAGEGGLRGVLRGVDGQVEPLEATALKVRCAGPGGLALRGRGLERRGVELEIGPAQAGAGLRVGGQGFGARRFPAGLRVRGRNGLCLVTAEVPFERYVAEVACRELGPAGAGPEALRAQAIVVRSYALTHLGQHAADGADFCDLSHCQVYPGEGACRPADLAALAAVQGLVLLDGERPAEVAYFSTCAGHTARAGEVWGPRAERPWLQGVPDGEPGRPACRGSPHGPWRLEVPRAELCAALRALRPSLGTGDCSLTRVEVGQGGWVRSVRVEAEGRWEIPGDEFRLILGRRFGWSAFRSGRWSVDERGGTLRFRGLGLGHGVGMCQHGALGMAREGAGYQAILARYFPGLRVGRLP